MKEEKVKYKKFSAKSDAIFSEWPDTWLCYYLSFLQTPDSLERDTVTLKKYGALNCQWDSDPLFDCMNFAVNTSLLNRKKKSILSSPKTPDQLRSLASSDRVLIEASLHVVTTRGRGLWLVCCHVSIAAFLISIDFSFSCNF